MFSKKVVKSFVTAALAVALTVTSVAPAPQAAASETDATPSATNISFATARDLTFNTSNSETMSSSDSKRYYKFTLDEASAVVVNLNP